MLTDSSVDKMVLEKELRKSGQARKNVEVNKQNADKLLKQVDYQNKKYSWNYIFSRKLRRVLICYTKRINDILYVPDMDKTDVDTDHQMPQEIVEVKDPAKMTAQAGVQLE